MEKPVFCNSNHFEVAFVWFLKQSDSEEMRFYWKSLSMLHLVLVGLI
jgi:hypothetical protein